MHPEDEDKRGFYLSLQPSEMAAFRGACQIYAAYIASGQVTPDTAADYRRQSIREAMTIAKLMEKSVESDDELRGGISP